MAQESLEPTRSYEPPDALEDDICVHIMTTSAALVGVCLTVIGLFKVVLQLRKVGTVGDDLLAADALVFLSSCILSYSALRSRRQRRRYRLERVADLLFLGGLCLMVVVCGLIAYEFV